MESTEESDTRAKADAFDCIWQTVTVLGFECGDTNKKRDLIQDIITGKVESHMMMLRTVETAVLSALWVTAVEHGPISERIERALVAARELLNFAYTSDRLYHIQEGNGHRIIWKDAAGEEHEIYKRAEH